MAKLLVKINQTGADAITVDETREEIARIMSSNIIFEAHIEGELRTFNRDYVYCVLDDSKTVVHNDRGQLV